MPVKGSAERMRVRTPGLGHFAVGWSDNAYNQESLYDVEPSASRWPEVPGLWLRTDCGRSLYARQVGFARICCGHDSDAGLPMLILVFPAAILLFLPIVVVETWFARHQLPSVSTNRRFAGVFAANAGSTIIGRPLTWIIMVLLQLFMIPEGSGSDFKLTPPFDAIANVIMGAAWLPPDEDNLHWMIPTAVMGLLIPAFFVSVFTEGLVLRDCWRETVSKERRSFVWVANFASYALLYAVTIVWLLYSIIRRGI
jgi:hypothetical protein